MSNDFSKKEIIQFWCWRSFEINHLIMSTNHSLFIFWIYHYFKVISTIQIYSGSIYNVLNQTQRQDQTYPIHGRSHAIGFSHSFTHNAWGQRFALKSKFNSMINLNYFDHPHHTISILYESFHSKNRSNKHHSIYIEINIRIGNQLNVCHLYHSFGMRVWWNVPGSRVCPFKFDCIIRCI